MALTIRLTRKGAKGQPFFRIVVADSRSPRDGRMIEQVGHYDPKLKTGNVTINEDKIRSWIGKGARPSDTVKSLLKAKGFKA
jgi:small subunit ribosomal protein S16